MASPQQRTQQDGEPRVGVRRSVLDRLYKRSELLDHLLATLDVSALQALHDEMLSINVNLRPITYQTKTRWQDALLHILQQVSQAHEAAGTARPEDAKPAETQ